MGRGVPSCICTQWPSVSLQHLEMLIAMALKSFLYGSDVTFAHIALAKASHMFTANLKDGKSDSILSPKRERRGFWEQP